MPAYQIKNNAFSTLAGSITNVATTLAVQTGHGDRFPAITGSDWTYITLQDAAGNIEIVKVTARAALSDTFTVTRAQEGTTARAWSAGDVVELRLTAGTATTADGTQTQTNKTIDGTKNTLLNPSVGEMLSAVAGTNTITASANAGITAYATGQVFTFIAAGANTGATTLNVNSLGAKNIYKSGSVALEAGDIATGQAISVVYDGTQFQISSGSGGGGAKAGGVIHENGTTISSNYTLTTGKNGLSVGPVTVASGVSVTVPSGQRWVVL